MPEINLADVTAILLDKAAKYPGVSEAEAYASRNNAYFVRLETLRHGGTTIGPSPQQMMQQTSIGAQVKVIVDGRVGTVFTKYLTTENLGSIVEYAVDSARSSPVDPKFRHLADPVSRTPVKLETDSRIYRGEVANVLLDQAQAAKSSIKDPRLDLAGTIMSVSEEISVRNTRGISVGQYIDTFCVAQLTLELMEGTQTISSGVGWNSSRMLSKLNAVKAVEDALELATVVPVKKTVPPGKYNIIFGPYAVADLFENMVTNNFALDAISMGSSWLPKEQKEFGDGLKLLHPKFGSKVADQSISLKENPTIRSSMASKAIDDEGIPTQPTVLLDNGVIKGVMASSYYSHLYGMPGCNGYRFWQRPGRHAFQDPKNVYATNLEIAPGNLSTEELIELSKSKGPTIMIGRTWYTYPSRPDSPGFSSSNRSTSFLIKGGQVIPIAPNAFKIKGDVSKILLSVYGLSKERKDATTWAAATSTIAPAIASSEGFIVEAIS